MINLIGVPYCLDCGQRFRSDDSIMTVERKDGDLTVTGLVHKDGCPDMVSFPEDDSQ